MATSKALQKAVSKYNKKSYDRLYILVKKGDKDKIKAVADKNGLSLNQFVTMAIDEKMNNEQEKSEI